MYASIVFLPLFGALIAGWLSLGNRDRAAGLVTVTVLLLSLGFSIVAFAQVGIGGQPITVDLARWIVSGDFEAMWRLRFDTLTVVMLIVVTGVSSMVHLYSVGYMSHDKSRARFMAYLSFFTFHCMYVHYSIFFLCLCKILVFPSTNFLHIFFIFTANIVCPIYYASLKCRA